MRICFYHRNDHAEEIDYDPAVLNLKKSIEKTRQALENAYSGFDNALEADLIDSYIYEINALQKKYAHLTMLAASAETESGEKLNQHSPVRTLINHVLG